MKVCFVTSESLMDHSFTMARELKRSIDLKVIITAKNYSSEISGFCEKLDAVFFRRGRFINPLSFLNEIKLMRFIRRQKADLVWFNNFSIYQSLLAKFFIKKLILNTHDVELHPDESDFHGIVAQKIAMKLYRRKIAVMSNTQQKIFEQKYSHTPWLLSLPVIDYYEACSESKTGNKKDSGETTKVKFLFFGSVLPYKGIERLLEATEILEKKGCNFELNICGRISYKNDEIKGRIKRNNNIKLKDEFIDYREVYRIYSENDMIVIPYIHVSQCGPMLIGYNQNVPLICSDLPGFREYVTEGSSGMLFDNTAGGLASGMEEIINEPAKIKKMSGFIASDIKNKFSMSKLAEDYISVFQKAIG